MRRSPQTDVVFRLDNVSRKPHSSQPVNTRFFMTL
jgi:hypothetical protein